MVGELIGGLGAFKAMLDITKGLLDISPKHHGAVIDLQGKILDA
jgi:hypothetical protein